jgi:hypothetical protein
MKEGIYQIALLILLALLAAHQEIAPVVDRLGRLYAAVLAEVEEASGSGQEARPVNETGLVAGFGNGATAATPAVATPTPLVAEAGRARGVLPHYQLHVSLDGVSNRVQVEQQVTLTNQSGEAWEKIVWNVSPAYWPGVFALHTAAVTQNGLSQVVTPTLDLTMLHVPLTQPLLPDGVVTVAFDYELNLPPLDPNGWAPEGNAGWANGLIQMGDWYPALVPYQAGAGWYTWEFVPVGDPVISELANYDVTIVAPPESRIAAAGFRGASGQERTYHLENARSFAFLASPRYVRFATELDGIPVSVYVLAEHQSEGPLVLDTAVQSMQLFTELYGPYPYPELVIAENGFLTAMEYSAFISLSGYAFYEYNQSPASLLVSVTVHEVGHQWWYGAVGNDQVEEPWLDESMAMLSELLFYEAYYPELVEWWWGYRVGPWNEPSYVNFSIYDFDDSPAFVTNVYAQGAYMMEELRELMGDAGFRAFLRNYYQQNRFHHSNREAFFAAVRAHTPSDLTTLLETYFQD